MMGPPRPQRPTIDLRARIGRYVRLEVLEPPHYEQLWRLVRSESIRWPLRGRPLSREGFVESLWRNTLVQYAILEKQSGGFLGVVGANDYAQHHGHAYLFIYLDPAAHGKGWPLEAVALLLNELFRRFPLYKVYGEVSDQMTMLQSASGEFFDIDGILPGHYVIEGERCDMTIISITRARWEEILRPLLMRSIWRSAVA